MEGGMSTAFAVIKGTGSVSTTGSGPDQIAATAADLDEVYKTEIRRLIGLGSVLMGSRSAGEDLAHDAFLLVLRRTQRNSGYLRSPAWPLLRTVLVRLAIQRRRSIAREARRLARFWEPAATESWDPDRDLIDWHAALRRLPSRMRACVVLFYGEDLSVADVARELGCSSRTVEHQLHSARQKLATTLGVSRNEDPGP